MNETHCSHGEIDSIQVIDSCPKEIYDAENDVNEFSTRLLLLERKKSFIFHKLYLKVVQDDPNAKNDKIKSKIMIDPEMDQIEAEVISVKSDHAAAKTKLNYLSNLFVAARKKVSVDLNLLSIKT